MESPGILSVQKVPGSLSEVSNVASILFYGALTCLRSNFCLIPVTKRCLGIFAELCGFQLKGSGGRAGAEVSGLSYRFTPALSLTPSLPRPATPVPTAPPKRAISRKRKPRCQMKTSWKNYVGAFISDKQRL